MKIKLYTSENKNEWDDFVKKSKNATFLFYRDFMEYHADRFNDYSLMFYKDDNSLIALMPGHISDKIYYTHQGLTYGGLLMGEQITVADVLSIFEYLTVTLRHQGIRKIVYKTIPHIYHKYPSEEDLYALFRYNATISSRNVSSSILIKNKFDYSRSRINGLKKAYNNNLLVNNDNNIDLFWQILTNNLKDRYDKEPVHSLSEIKFLKERFNNNIELFSVSDAEGEMFGGCLVFITDTVVHAQYTAATEEGKRKGAIDAVVNHIIGAYPEKKYFDYGISTENHGWYLNESLIYQKEGFGARGIVYDTYTIDLS